MIAMHIIDDHEQFPLDQLERALKVAAELLVDHGAAYAPTFRRIEAAAEHARRDDPVSRARLLLQNRAAAA